MPIVFVTGYGDIPMTVQALKAGASDFLTKPVQAQALLRAVRGAIEEGASVRRARAATAKLPQRYDGLTPREREVLTLLVTGALNKQIAATLGRRRADDKVPSCSDHGTHGSENGRRAHAYRCEARDRHAFRAARPVAALNQRAVPAGCHKP